MTEQTSLPLLQNVITGFMRFLNGFIGILKCSKGDSLVRFWGSSLSTCLYLEDQMT